MLVPAIDAETVQLAALTLETNAEEQVAERTFRCFERLFPDPDQRIALLSAYLKKEKAMLRGIKKLTKAQLEGLVEVRDMLVAYQRANEEAFFVKIVK